MNVDLSALEIGAVLLLARNHKISGWTRFDSCAAVIVFVHFRWFAKKSCKSCMDLSARKVKGKLRGVSFWCANPRMAETCEVLVAVSESDMSHDVFFPCHDEGTQVPDGVERNWSWSQTESSNCQSRLFFTMLGRTGKNGNSRLNSSLSELEQVEGMTIAIASSEHPKRLKCAGPCILCKERLRSLVVGGNPGSRAVVFPIPRVGLLEERPAVSGRREKTQREELQCQVEDDTAEGLVAKTVKILLVTSLGWCDDRLTAGVCTFPTSTSLTREGGVCLHGKSNRRSRVVDVRILEGSMVDRTRQGVRECSTMCQR